jgi:hypothetical protein
LVVLDGHFVVQSLSYRHEDLHSVSARKTWNHLLPLR